MPTPKTVSNYFHQDSSHDILSLYWLLISISWFFSHFSFRFLLQLLAIEANWFHFVLFFPVADIWRWTQMVLMMLILISTMVRESFYIVFCPGMKRKQTRSELVQNLFVIISFIIPFMVFAKSQDFLTMSYKYWCELPLEEARVLP